MGGSAAVIVVAEGSGQEHLEGVGSSHDASGNLRLGDIGAFLEQRIRAYFRERSIPATVRYIDPSYTLRSLPANSTDSELCLILGQHAAHAALAGRTRVLISYWNQRFVHVPIPLAIHGRKQLDPAGDLWNSVLWATGQPASML